MQLISISNREGQAVTRLFQGLGDLNNYLAGQGCLDGTEIKFWDFADFWQAPIPDFGYLMQNQWLFVTKNQENVNAHIKQKIKDHDLIGDVDYIIALNPNLFTFEEYPFVLDVETLISDESISDFKEKLPEVTFGPKIKDDYFETLSRYSNSGFSFNEAFRRLRIECIISVMGSVNQESFTQEMKDYLEAGLYWFETQGIELPKAL